VSEVVTGRRCSREVASCKMSPEFSLYSVSYIGVFLTIKFSDRRYLDYGEVDWKKQTSECLKQLET